MPGKRRESGREWSDVGQGEGGSRDAERAAEELADPHQGFCHHITMHGDVFRACVVLTPVGRFLGWKMRIRDRMK